MSSQQLSYDSLKCVLQYMEVDKRLLVSNKCPTIRTAERIVPLRMDSLEFSTGQITLDNTIYRIGIYQHSATGSTSPSIKRNNENGGVQCEMDKYGIEIESDKFAQFPGDVEMGRIVMLNDKTDEENIWNLSRRIKHWEEESEPNLSDPGRNEILEDWNTELVAYKNRRDNVKPPHEQFFQLSVISENKIPKYIERYRYDKKYSEAMKQLATFVFGNRRCFIRCNRFSVLSDVVRLPTGVQFQIADLYFRHPIATGLEALKLVIHESSYPLEHFKNPLLKIADLTHPVVQNAASITIYNNVGQALFFSFLKNVTNKRVSFSSFIPISTGFLLAVIKDLVQRDRPIGTQISLISMTENAFAKSIKAIQKQFNVPIVNGRIILISMTNERQLAISRTRNLLRTRTTLWNVQMIIRPREQD